MATLTFGNLPVDMRYPAEGFGMSPVKAGLNFLGSYEPIDSIALVDTQSYLELRAWDASYHYTTMYLWIVNQTNFSILLSRLGIRNDSTGFYAELSGSMQITSDGSFSGIGTGILLKNRNTGELYLSASGFSEQLDDDMPDLNSMQELIGELSGNDSISGGAGNDYLLGFGGHDIIRGNGGNDTIDGGLGNDSMYGGTGNDTFLVNGTTDLVVELGGQGVDTVKATISYSLVDTDGAGPSGGNVENLTLLGSAANAIGNGLANLLVGNALANVLSGGTGADSMLGGAGNDTYIVDNVNDKVYETTTISSQVNAGGVDLVKSSVSFNLSSYAGVSFVENLQLNSSGPINGTGNALNNVLYADSGNNVIDGVGGSDTVSYIYSSAAVAIDLRNTSAAQATGGSGSDLIRNVENVTGSSYNDRLTGNAAANVLSGGTGPDTLIGLEGADRLLGGAGNDVLDGGSGIDTMTGGDGNDVYYVRDAGDVVSETTATVATGGTDTVYSYLAACTLGANVENGRIVSAGAANLSGNDLNNALYAGVGNNVLNGGAGTDTASYAYGTASGVGVKVSLAVATAQATGGSGTDTLLGIECLIGSAFADTLTGNSAGNVLTGGGGRDVLKGNGGNDVFDFNALSEMGTTSGTWDVITDFSAGDRIDLSTLDANTATSVNDAFSGTLVASFTGAGQLKFAGGVLYGNTDADSTPEFAIALTGVSALSSTAITL